MAITENSFTAEEFKAAVAANPALVAVVKTHFSSEGGAVRTKQEEDEFKQNFEADVVRRKTSEFATNLEKDILELTGVEKQSPDQKYFDYLKHAVTSKLGEVDTMKTELENLKKNPNSKPEDAIRIKQLEDGIKAEQKKLTDLQTQHTNELKKTKIEMQLATEMSKLKFKEGLPESVVAVYKQNVLTELTKAAQLQEDGTLSFLDAEGKPMIGSDYKVKTADQVLADKFKDVIESGHQQPGAGSNPTSQSHNPGSNPNPNGPTPITGLPADVKNKVQLVDFLKKSGYTDDQPEFATHYETLGKDLPLR